MSGHAVGPDLASPEILEGAEHAAVVLTCEHASNALPPPWTWPEPDRWIVDTHWAWDPGVADLTRALARAIDAPAVLCRWTRLLCDVNRPLDADTTFRALADGHPVWLNRDLTDAERRARAELVHGPYHDAVDRVVARHPRAAVLSMHSFTPIYEGGPPRSMEIGVLFDREEEVSVLLAESLAREGWRVALNEPYSGRDGLIYSASRHADRHHRRALELEIRNDVAQDAARREPLVRAVHHALVHAGLA